MNYSDLAVRYMKDRSFALNDILTEDYCLIGKDVDTYHKIIMPFYHFIIETGAYIHELAKIIYSCSGSNIFEAFRCVHCSPCRAHTINIRNAGYVR